jgi:S-formylglutathione hydrolase FrmB
VTISAPALANNLLGEAPERELLVYLPVSYSESQKRYPVVYYLLDFGAPSVPTGLRPEDIQKDIEAGYAKEMLIVVVSGVNALGGSFYVNSPVTGSWDDFITQDVVGYVDAHYRTIPKPASRGIGGNGMGGSGALSLAMRHPDVFSAVYSLSPYLFDDNGLAESPMFSPPGMIDGFVDLQARELLLPLDDAVSDMQNNAGGEQFALAYGAAFAPNPQAGPPYVDYPYRRQNGQLSRDETVWKRWEAGFGAVPDKIQTYKANLLKLNSIAIDYGANDPYRWLPRGCQYFSAQLTAAGIPNQLVSFPGDPQASLEQRIRAFMLPFFSKKLVFEN